MSIQTTKIANQPAYVARFGDIKEGEKVDTDIFFSGMGEMASQTSLGLPAIKKHGQPKFFTAAWPKRIVVAIQYPNLTYNSALIDAIVKAVKTLPNVGSIYATGLSQGAIYWGKYLSGDDGTRARQFAGCFLMSGSNIATSKVANFKHLKMVLFSGSEALDTRVPPKNYESVNAVFKKAGVDITYCQLNAGHTDTVWNYFSPVKFYNGFKPYEKLSTPAGSIVTPAVVTPVTNQNPAMSVQIIKGNTAIDGTKGNVYMCAGANVEITLPDAPETFSVWLRNTTSHTMHFNKPLHYDETSVQSLNSGLFRIFWNGDTKSYWLMRNV